MLDAGGMLRTLGALRKVSGLATDPRVRRGSDTTSRSGRPRGWPTKRRARGGDGRRGAHVLPRGGSLSRGRAIGG